MDTVPEDFVVSLFWSVCLGGALGSGLRYVMTLLVPNPLAVFLVNLVGSFGLGVVVSTPITSEWRTVLGAGVMGGFTTYSAFNQNLLSLPRLSAVAYAAATLVLCLGAGAIGMMLGEWWRARL